MEIDFNGACIMCEECLMKAAGKNIILAGKMILSFSIFHQYYRILVNGWKNDFATFYFS